MDLSRSQPSQQRHSGVFIVNFEQNSHLVLVFMLLALNMQLPAGIKTAVWFTPFWSVFIISPLISLIKQADVGLLP